MGLYWVNPEITPAEQCRMDACIIISNDIEPEGDVEIQTIPGGPYMVNHFEIAPEDFPKAWEEAFKNFMESGNETTDAPCYELYLNTPEDHPECKCIVDICIPLKK